MEFLNTWETFENPNLATGWSVVVAAVVTALIAWPVVRTARRAGKFKPQSALLLLVPALLIAGGGQIDEKRELEYRQSVTASGAVESSWSEIEAAIQAKYTVSSVEPFEDPVELVNVAYNASEDGTAPVTPPLVEVQMPDSTAVEVYWLIVEPTDSGIDVSLERQASAAMLDEGIDPERLLTAQ